MTKVSEDHFLKDRNEINPILNLIKNTSKFTEDEILNLIGYSPGYLRGERQVRVTLKYALRGLATELHIGQDKQQIISRNIFSFDELATLFDALLSLKKHTAPSEEVKKLITKLAAELAK